MAFGGTNSVNRSGQTLFSKGSDHAARTADSDAAVRDILGDNTSGPDCGALSDRDSRQDDRTTSDPGVVLDRNRLGDGDAGIPAPGRAPFLRNDRMGGRVDLHI